MCGAAQFDGIFFDTFGEYYQDMRLFQNALPKILKPGGVYSFFNGARPDSSAPLRADRAGAPQDCARPTSSSTAWPAR